MYVFRCICGQEIRAKSEIEDLGKRWDMGITCIVPMMTYKSYNRNQKKFHEGSKPVFPGYIFAGGRKMRWEILAGHGINRQTKLGCVVKWQNAPSKLPDSVVNYIASTNWSAPDALRRGQRVRVTDGAFAHMEGVVDLVRDDRVRTLIECLGGVVPVDVSVGNLEAA